MNFVVSIAWILVAARSAYLCLTLPMNSKLPMQWNAHGAVNWSAPAWIALGVIPAISLLSFTLLRYSAPVKPHLNTDYRYWALTAFMVISHLAYTHFALRQA